tara:strand:- start:511 stop:1029 length:519 start_codon:yes stop_codon:yes gene_type:complete
MSEPVVKGIYIKNILTRKIHLPFSLLGNNIKELLQQKISKKYEGICIKEGFLKPNSIEIITYSSGVVKGDNVLFDVAFNCLICKPVEGMRIKVNVKNVTKAGIRAEYKEPTPIVVFISRDQSYADEEFNSIKEDDTIYIKVIGIRYELNDTFISVIASIDKKIVRKPKISFN